MEFVKLTKELLPVAKDIQNKAFDGEYDDYANKVLPDMSDKKDEHFFLIKVENKIVGSVSAIEDPISPKTFGLGWVAILPKYQGKGLGKKMVREFLKKLQRDVCNGDDCTFLLAAADEEQKFYGNLGFEIGNKLHCGARIMSKIIRKRC